MLKYLIHLEVQNRLIMRQKWELSFHQDLISSWFWHRVRTRSEALISQKFDLISSHKKIFDFILQEYDLISVWFHLISWKSDLISQRNDFILILFHFILISFHLISQKHDFISILTWDQNEMKYSDSDLVILIIQFRNSRKCYQVALSMLISTISTSILKVKTILNKKKFSQLIFFY